MTRSIFRHLLNYRKYGTFAHIFEGQPESKQHQWTTTIVKEILSNEVYIGSSVHNKQSTIYFKNKKTVRKSKDEWFTVENTHETMDILFARKIKGI